MADAGERGRAEVLAVHTEAPGEVPLRRAAEALLRGEAVALPTDTLYGLCARALDAQAIERLFAAKGRTEEKGAPVLIGHREHLALLAGPAPARARAVMEALWPGPLTLILPARRGLPPLLTGGAEGGVAVRLPAQTLCRTLALMTGPFAATSANRPGEPPLCDASGIAARFAGKISLILDGGPLGETLPSTVVDARGDRPLLVRQGAVPLEAVLRAWERRVGRGA